MPTRAFYLFDFVLFSLPQHLVRRVPSNRWWVEHDDAVRSRWNYSPVPVLEKFVVTFYIMDDILKTREVCVMGQESRIKPGRNQFARLISEVDGLCPLCQEELIQLEHDVPGKSDLIAKQVNLFYSELSRTNFSQ